MPELPEVERARSLLAEIAEGKRITDIQTFEDTIVYTGGTTHDLFKEAFQGKTIQRVLRVGKQLYFTTDGPSGLVHLGMSGHTFVKGAHQQMYYRKIRPKDLDENGEPLWPPRYVKLMLTLETGEQWAFTDARRLGRIRMVDAGVDPLSVPPLSLLGRDGLNDLPSIEELSAVFKKRSAPIKALLLDQNGPVAGIGNYLIGMLFALSSFASLESFVDEICFQSRIHPAQRANTLDEAQTAEIHKQIKAVIGTAVAAKADYRQFPSNWIFSVRWSKGKRGETPQMKLDNGELAPVHFETVGGRTSAIVKAVQKIPKHAEAATSSPGKAKGSSASKRKKQAASSDETEDSDADVLEALENEDERTTVAQIVVETPTRTPPKRKASRSGNKSPYFEHDGSEQDDAEEGAASPPKKKRSIQATRNAETADQVDKKVKRKRGKKR